MPRRSSPLRPRSVPGLLVAGFGIVALPLLLALGVGAVYVDRLASQSERLVRQGVAVTRLSRQAQNRITAMERSARQFAVLGDPVLVERFNDHHDAFSAALDDLGRLQLETMPGWNLTDLRHEAELIRRALLDSQIDGDAFDAEMSRFETMRDLAQGITDQGNVFIDREVARIESTAGEVGLFLLLCTVALVPATVALVILFTVVISRPIRQIRAAIQRLGGGRFDQPVVISAPSAELDDLGVQLDRMRQRLDELEGEKNRFLRHMSHELKTPLASIREGVSLLDDDSLGGLAPPQREVVAILQRNSLELTSLIDNLLDFAAWREQHAQIDATEFDLRELVEQVLDRHRLTLDSHRLITSLPESGLVMNADRDRWRLIFDNLLTNAIKFSPDGGRIDISGQRLRRGMIIEVTDDGPGIPAEEREQVFTPFYQAHPDPGRHVRGTGIGLSVVREAVQAHGGDIEILDQAGRGACLRIRLPRRSLA